MPNHHDRPVYALRNWSVKKRAKGWYISPTTTTYSGEKSDWRGPYSSVASAALMIARELSKEVVKRHERTH